MTPAAAPPTASGEARPDPAPQPRAGGREAPAPKSLLREPNLESGSGDPTQPGAGRRATETRSRHLKHFKYAVNQLDGAALLPLPAQLQLRLLLSWLQPESSGSHLGVGRLRVLWGPRGIPRALLSLTGVQTLPGHLLVCSLHTHEASTTSRGAVAPSWCHITCPVGMKVRVEGEAG